MNRSIFVFFCILFVLVSTTFAQEVAPSPVISRPRVVGPTPTPKLVVVTSTLPAPTPKPVVTPTPAVEGTGGPSEITSEASATATTRILSFGQIRSRLEEAKRQMAARPIPTASTDNLLGTSIVRIAFYDWDTQQIDYVVLTKELFLKKDIESVLSTSNSKTVKIRTIRGNGVNTPVVITDMGGNTHLPLMVQYPVERNGKFYEMAYYMSTHPGLVTPEVVNAGKLYIRSTIDVAREKLREKGIFISPVVADMAERLCIVEHVDHYRFRTEYHPNIFNDIYALYALNEGQTYRYSVSSAGAGGMIQMIPSTYAMVRSRYSHVGLMPDFVEGMRNHPNAAQAMLLYMQMTWDDLISSSTISQAIQDGIATPAELMSAGYNSNPARLAGYIKRGGANWRNLIPRETQIYLQINASMDRYVPMVPRTK